MGVEGHNAGRTQAAICIEVPQGGFACGSALNHRVRSGTERGLQALSLSAQDRLLGELS